MQRFAGTELSDLELTGPRVTLRRWQRSDAPRVHEIVDGGGMREFLNLPDPYTLEVAHDYVGDIGHEGRDDGSGLGSAVIDTATGRLLGSAALRLTGDPHIGFWIAPEARGYGYAAEVTRVLAQFAFSLGVPRVRLACAVTNLASIRTALGAGFRFEGVDRAAVLAAAQPGAPERRGLLARFARLADDPEDPVAPAFPVLPPGGLSDGTVQLRTLAEQDTAALIETQDDESVRWSFSGQPRTPDELADWTARSGLNWAVGTAANSAIVDVASGRVAGDITLRMAGPPGVGGIGYSVHPAFRGRGYTTRALRLLAPWAFDAVGLGRLELGAKEANVASQRAAANAGFDYEGVRRGRMRNSDGSFTDEVRYYLLAPERPAT